MATAHTHSHNHHLCESPGGSGRFSTSKKETRCTRPPEPFFFPAEGEHVFCTHAAGIHWVNSYFAKLSLLTFAKGWFMSETNSMQSNCWIIISVLLTCKVLIKLTSFNRFRFRVEVYLCLVFGYLKMLVIKFNNAKGKKKVEEEEF